MKKIIAWTDEVQNYPEVASKHMMYFEDSLLQSGDRILQRLENFYPYHHGFQKLFDSDEVLGRVSDLFVDRGPSSDLQLSWGSSCAVTDTDYAVYEGILGDFSNHVSVTCTTGDATSTTVLEPAFDSYYLIVPLNSTSEGSYGLRSDGQRPVGVSTCAPQLLLDVCN